MDSEDLSAIRLGYLQTEAALRREEIRAREVRTVIQAQELRQISESRSFGAIKDKLAKVVKEPEAHALQLKISSDLGRTLKAQKMKLTAVAEELGRSRLEQQAVLKSKKQTTEKLERLSELLSQKKLLRARRAESLEQEEMLELRSAKHSLSKLQNATGQLQRGQSSLAPLANELKNGLTSHALKESEAKDNSDEKIEEVSPATQFDMIGEQILDAPFQLSDNSNSGSPSGNSQLNDSNARSSNFGGQSSPFHFAHSSGRQEHSSRSAQSKFFGDLMVKTPGEYASQIEGLKSWQGISGSGVSFSFETQSGAKLKLELSGNSNNDLRISISPESELNRRTLWSERSRIAAALKARGLSVKEILIKPYQPE